MHLSSIHTIMNVFAVFFLKKYFPENISEKLSISSPEHIIIWEQKFEVANCAFWPEVSISKEYDISLRYKNFFQALYPSGLQKIAMFSMFRIQDIIHVTSSIEYFRTVLRRAIIIARIEISVDLSLANCGFIYFINKFLNGLSIQTSVMSTRFNLGPDYFQHMTKHPMWTILIESMERECNTI